MRPVAVMQLPLTLCIIFSLSAQGLPTEGAPRNLQESSSVKDDGKCTITVNHQKRDGRCKLWRSKIGQPGVPACETADHYADFSCQCIWYYRRTNQLVNDTLYLHRCDVEAAEKEMLESNYIECYAGKDGQYQVKRCPAKDPREQPMCLTIQAIAGTLEGARITKECGGNYCLKEGLQTPAGGHDAMKNAKNPLTFSCCVGNRCNS